MHKSTPQRLARAFVEAQVRPLAEHTTGVAVGEQTTEDRVLSDRDPGPGRQAPPGGSEPQPLGGLVQVPVALQLHPECRFVAEVAP